jgi:hypothetical protein
MFVAFEQVNQLDDVFVLAHFQNLDLSPLLENLNWLHVGFGNSLYSYLHSKLLVSS